MVDALLALDPGTHQTGVAIFNGEKLEQWRAIQPPNGMEVEDRIGWIVSFLDRYVGFIPEFTHVAIEKPQGIDSHRPAPELQVLVRRLKRWAKAKPRGWGWTEYHPSTVLASVRLRAIKADTKTIIQLGVMALYPQVGGYGVEVQDVYDAIAVGHCHIVKTREAVLLGEKNV